MNNIYGAAFSEASNAIAALPLGDSGTPVTYAQLKNHVDALRGATSINAGDKVALVMPNSLELIIGLFAVWAQGAATAPLNPAYTSTEFKVSERGCTHSSSADRYFL